MRCRMFSSVTGLCRAGANSKHPFPTSTELGSSEMSSDIAKCLLGGNSPLVENHSSKSMGGSSVSPSRHRVSSQQREDEE